MYKKKRVVLICGDRAYKNRVKIGRLISTYSDRIILLIEGGASGADQIGWEYAKLLGIPIATFEANWSKYGKAAGPIRNRSMIIALEAFKKAGYKTEVWVFHRNLKKSKGTLDMVTIAREENILVKIFK